MAAISFDLSRTSREPGWIPDALASHDALWRQFVSTASYTAGSSNQVQSATANNGFTFDSSQGDINFRRLRFADGGGSEGPSHGRGPTVVRLDWTGADTAVLSLEKGWNSIKNAEVSSFSGTALTVENFVDTWVHLNDAIGRRITIEGAKRGEVTTGGGDDVVTIGIDSNSPGWTNQFLVDAGAGNDLITLRASSFNAIGGCYDGRFTDTLIRAGAGDDRIIGWGSDDTVDGGAGYDVFVLRGVRAGYSITAVGQVTTIIDINRADGDDGRDVLTGIERISFRDGGVFDFDAPPEARDDIVSLAAPIADLTASLLANDIDPEGGGLSISAVGASSLGTVTLAAGAVLFSMDGAAFAALGEGQQATGSFTYTVRDAGGQTDTAVASLTVTGVNDTASISGNATGAVSEDGILSASGKLDIADLDAGQAGFLAPASLAGVYGNFTFNAATGDWTYALDNAAVNVQALLAGQNVTDSLTVTSLDGSAAQAITVSIAGTRDAPIAFDDTLSLNEDTVLDNLCPCPRGFTLRNDTIDPGGDYAALVVDGPQHGTLVFRLNGSFSYTPVANFSGTDSFTYRISNEGLLSNIATVTLTVDAVNDTPLAGADSYSTAHNTALTVPVATGLLANDSDVESSALSALLEAGPAHGTLALNPDGSFSYTPDAGYSGADSFTYRASDGQLVSALTTVSLTVGAAPPPGVSTGTVAEDGMLTAGGTLGAADLGSGFATPPSLAGSYGSFGFNTATGQWSYALNNGAANVQALNAGESVTDVLTVTSSAGTRPITVTVNGANDLAAIGGTSTGSVTEDATLSASGRLTVSDVDAGQARFTAPPSLAGVYGNFTFDATTGDWSYALNNAAANVQALASGQTVTDVLNVASLDGTASQAITVSVAGANEVGGPSSLVARNESYTVGVSFPAGGAPPESGTTGARVVVNAIGGPSAPGGFVYETTLIGPLEFNTGFFGSWGTPTPGSRHYYNYASDNIVNNDDSFGAGIEIRIVETVRPGGILNMNPLTGAFTYQSGYDWSVYMSNAATSLDPLTIPYSDYFRYQLYNPLTGELSNVATVFLDLFESINNNECYDPLASESIGHWCQGVPV